MTHASQMHTLDLAGQFRENGWAAGDILVVRYECGVSFAEQVTAIGHRLVLAIPVAHKKRHGAPWSPPMHEDEHLLFKTFSTGVIRKATDADMANLDRLLNGEIQ